MKSLTLLLPVPLYSLSCSYLPFSVPPQRSQVRTVHFSSAYHRFPWSLAASADAEYERLHCKKRVDPQICCIYNGIEPQLKRDQTEVRLVRLHAGNRKNETRQLNVLCSGKFTPTLPGYEQMVGLLMIGRSNNSTVTCVTDPLRASR